MLVPVVFERHSIIKIFVILNCRDDAVRSCVSPRPPIYVGDMTAASTKVKALARIINTVLVR